jgi:hypothetical protein
MQKIVVNYFSHIFKIITKLKHLRRQVEKVVEFN